MASEKQPNDAHLPIARHFPDKDSDNISRKPVKSSDSISMRKDKKPVVSASVRTIASDSTIKNSNKGFELESQKPPRKHSDDGPGRPSPKGSDGRKPKSWLVKLHPCSQTIEDSVMGTSDGMTVPFALTASLAGIAPNARYIMLAGLAELTAGAISMGLGGALQARVEKESYAATVKATRSTILKTPDHIPTIIDDLFLPWSFTPETLAHISYDLSRTPLESQTAFLVRFHHELSVPDNSRVLKSSATLGSTYFLAGFLGLFPYMIVHRDEIKTALYASIAIEVVALWVFGWLKTGVSVGWSGRENLRKGFVGAVIMVAVGAIAAGIAVGLITVVDKSEHVSA